MLQEGLLSHQRDGRVHIQDQVGGGECKSRQHWQNSSRHCHYFQIEDVELLDKRGYLTVSLTLAKEASKVLLRKPEGIRDWYQALRVGVQTAVSIDLLNNLAGYRSLSFLGSDWNPDEVSFLRDKAS